MTRVCRPRFLDFASRGHHEIGQFVDDDNQVRHLPVPYLLGVFSPPRFYPLVVIHDIPDARGGESVVTIFHLVLDALQNAYCGFGRRDDFFSDVR